MCMLVHACESVSVCGAFPRVPKRNVVGPCWPSWICLVYVSGISPESLQEVRSASSASLQPLQALSIRHTHAQPFTHPVGMPALKQSCTRQTTQLSVKAGEMISCSQQLRPLSSTHRPPAVHTGSLSHTRRPMWRVRCCPRRLCRSCWRRYGDTACNSCLSSLKQHGPSLAPLVVLLVVLAVLLAARTSLHSRHDHGNNHQQHQHFHRRCNVGDGYGNSANRFTNRLPKLTVWKVK